MEQELLDRLVAAVVAHYGDGGGDKPLLKPLLLSRFGQLHRDLLADLRTEYGSLAKAVNAAGPDKLRIIAHRGGQEAVAPSALAADIEKQVKETSAVQELHSSSFDVLPGSVKIAFCLKTDAGEHVALQIVPPFRYEKISDPRLVRPNYRIVSDEFRRPGLLLKSSTPTDRDALWRDFLLWTQAENLDAATFNSARQTNALARLFAAQDADILPRLNIPADIAALLMKRP